MELALVRALSFKNFALVMFGKKHDVNRIMALGEKISAQFRNFFARLAESAARLSDKLKALLRIR